MNKLKEKIEKMMYAKPNAYQILYIICGFAIAMCLVALFIMNTQ